MSKLSPFGKALRVKRIERDLLLGTVARELGVSSSYLSQVETGGKPIPDDFVDRLRPIMALTDAEVAELQRAAAAATAEFKISMKRGAPVEDRILAHALARQFATLSPAQKRALGSIVSKGN